MARRTIAPQRERAARALRDILDGRLFAALCEPVRVGLVEFLTIHGRCDIASIAAAFPQDRSVISRHLSVLHAAGVLRREKIGRHVFFELDGFAVIAQLERILERFRRIVALCCPEPTR